MQMAAKWQNRCHLTEQMGRLYSKNVKCTWNSYNTRSFLLEMQDFVWFDLLFCIRPDIFTIFALD